jgi:hypothetical protein
MYAEDDAQYNNRIVKLPESETKKTTTATNSSTSPKHRNPQKVKPPGKHPKTTTTTIAQFRKAPDAPKRFKSAFILFSAEKHKEIRAQLGQKSNTERVSRHLQK